MYSLRLSSNLQLLAGQDYQPGSPWIWIDSPPALKPLFSNHSFSGLDVSWGQRTPGSWDSSFTQFSQALLNQGSPHWCFIKCCLQSTLSDGNPLKQLEQCAQDRSGLHSLTNGQVSALSLRSIIGHTLDYERCLWEEKMAAATEISLPLLSHCRDL